MSNEIIVFGRPGVGKGTRLSKFLDGKEGYYVLGVGNLLRKAFQENTELGKQAKAYMDAGKLVPDDIINEIVIEAIKNCEGTVILDGYPRTINQARAMLKAKIYPEKVVEVQLDDSVLIERAKNRIVCSKCGEPYTTDSYKRPKVEGKCDKCQGELIRRPDDDEEIVKQRLEVYEKETAPVLNFLHEVAGIDIYTIDNNSDSSEIDFENAMND